MLEEKKENASSSIQHNLINIVAANMDGRLYTKYLVVPSGSSFF